MSKDLYDKLTSLMSMHKQSPKNISSTSRKHYIPVRKRGRNHLLTTYLAQGRQPAECDDDACKTRKPERVQELTQDKSYPLKLKLTPQETSQYTQIRQTVEDFMIMHLSQCERHFFSSTASKSSLKTEKLQNDI